MELRWEYLTPPAFKKLAKEEQICILPLASLECHGDHMPFGTDTMVAYTVACRGAALEPCVVFPPYWFGQVHEAAAFPGTINFPTGLLLKMLETLLDQIAQNGFKKILILNGHGGNSHFLQYFAMSQMDRKVDYTLYSHDYNLGPRQEALDIWERPGGGHADEWETSLTMAAMPGAVKLDQQPLPEPVLPGTDLKHLRDNNIHTALWWYGMYPENVTGSPSWASAEKGEKALQAAAEDLADVLRIIKDDTAAPRLQKEFYERIAGVKRGE